MPAISRPAPNSHFGSLSCIKRGNVWHDSLIPPDEGGNNSRNISGKVFVYVFTVQKPDKDNSVIL